MKVLKLGTGHIFVARGQAGSVLHHIQLMLL